MLLGGYSETGPRDANEDSYYTRVLPGTSSFTNGVDSFFMVSDGMGGYQGGDIASSLAVSSAERYLENLLAMTEGNQVEFEPDVALGEIVQNAHEAIVAETQERGNANMGATFVGVFASSSHAWIGHVGDSRAYLLRDGVAMQVTEDHSQVGRMLSRRMITEEEAQNHPMRNRIERALGFADHDIEFNEVDLQLGDAIVLVSDGAYTVLGAKELCAIVARSEDANQAAQSIVRSAIRNHTDDNTTAVVAQVALARTALPTRRLQRRNGKRVSRDNAHQSTLRRGGTARRQVGMQGGSAGSSADGAKPRSNRRPRRGASIVPFVLLFFVLAGAVVGFVALTTADKQMGAAPQVQSSGTESAETSQATPVAEETGASENTPISHDAMDYYNVTDSSARIRFVSGEESARLFTATIAGLSVDPVLTRGNIVRASAQPSSFVEAASQERREFLLLDDRYVEDLKNDCKQYVQDTRRPFYSELSSKIPASSYKTLVDALTQAGTSELGIDIKHLAVLSDDLTPVASDFAAESMGVTPAEGDQEASASPYVGDQEASAPPYEANQEASASPYEGEDMGAIEEVQVDNDLVAKTVGSTAETPNDGESSAVPQLPSEQLV